MVAMCLLLGTFHQETECFNKKIIIKKCFFLEKVKKKVKKIKKSRDRMFGYPLTDGILPHVAVWMTSHPTRRLPGTYHL